MSNNILEPIPPSLNNYLLKYNSTTLSSTTPSAPGGNTNVTFQKDGFGNISAYVPTSSGGGAPTPGVANALYKSDGAGAWTQSSFSDNYGTGFTTAFSSLSFSAPQLTINVGSGLKPFSGNYGCLTFNGATDGTAIGIFGDSTSVDKTMYFDMPQTGTFSYRISVSGTPTLVANLSSTLLTVPNVALSAATSTTSATAGAATALPATPQGYLTVNINGTDRKIPYYAV